jgi:hypothetical protein
MGVSIPRFPKRNLGNYKVYVDFGQGMLHSFIRKGFLRIPV